jgi:hypothetical protein
MGINIEELMLDINKGKTKEPKEEKPEKQHRSTCLKRSDKSIYRRAFSETQLLDLVTEKFKDGESYHFITGGGCGFTVIFENSSPAAES